MLTVAFDMALSRERLFGGVGGGGVCQARNPVQVNCACPGAAFWVVGRPKLEILS